MGTLKLKDRKLDLIVSGGKKISTVDVEAVLFSHPAVFDYGPCLKDEMHACMDKISQCLLSISSLIISKLGRIK